MLPRFDAQPDEESELQPAVVSAIRQLGYRVFVEKTCDLLIIREGKSPLNLELKVRLRSQRQKVPVTPFQWALLRSVGHSCSFAETTRFLIFDGISGTYAFARCVDVSPGLTTSSPRSTSYVTRKTLDALAWQSPEQAWVSMTVWLRDA